MRTTLGTQLARHGTKPQVARQIMRHSDYKTTLKHYTVLGLDDTAGAINQIPDIGAPQTVASTGTMDADIQPQQYTPQRQRKTVQHGAKPCKDNAVDGGHAGDRKSIAFTEKCDTMRRDAPSSDNGADRARTGNFQLAKLALSQLSYGPA